MFRESLLRFDRVDGHAIPRYLTSKDRLWVQALQEEFEACVGKRKKELVEKLRGLTPHGESRVAREGMTWLLGSLHPSRVASPVSPARVREVVFGEGAGGPPDRSREGVLEAAARILEVEASAFEGMLYADLPGERVIHPPPSPLGAGELIERYNLSLAQGMLLKAERLRVTLEGQARAVVRYAKLHRLICTVEGPSAAESGASLEVSGPLSLFRQTAKYGRAMALFLPALTRAPRWSLEAECLLRGERLRFAASFRDPIGSSHAVPKAFDSRLEERLYKDLKKLPGPWRAVREADPIQAGRRILFPDFTLVRSSPRGEERILVEIVGFWSPRYLEAKIAGLKDAERRDLVLCVNEDLSVEETEIPPGSIFRFQRRIEAARLIAFTEEAIREGTIRPRRS